MAICLQRLAEEMRRKVIQEVTFAGLIAAIYYVITILSAPLSFGQVQCRLSEVLLFLCLKNRFAVWGYTIGCMLPTLTSPLGIIDVIVGGGYNLVCGMVAYNTGRKIPTFLTATVGSGLVVGAEMRICYGLPMMESAFFVALGQAIALTIGLRMYTAIGDRLQRVINRYV